MTMQPQMNSEPFPGTAASPPAADRAGALASRLSEPRRPRPRLIAVAQRRVPDSIGMSLRFT